MYLVIWVTVWINNYQNDQLRSGSEGQVWVLPEKGRLDFRNCEILYLSLYIFLWVCHACKRMPFPLPLPHSSAILCSEQLWVKYSQEEHQQNCYRGMSHFRFSVGPFPFLYLFPVCLFITLQISLTHIMLDFICLITTLLLDYK